MDEILASIRRIIEGREEAETPAEAPQDRVLKSVPQPVSHEALRMDVKGEKAPHAAAPRADLRSEESQRVESSRAEEAPYRDVRNQEALRVESTPRANAADQEALRQEAPRLEIPSQQDAPRSEVPRVEARSSEAERAIVEGQASQFRDAASPAPKAPFTPAEDTTHTSVGLKAVNDEGTTPFAGAKTSEVERQVASQMEELATVSVARMRAASLEDAVRGFRKNGVEDADPEAGDEADIDAQAFSSEFDEAAFATELLVNAGLMDEPLSQPEAVTPAEAVKLRLAYPESPAEGEIAAEASLETAIGAAIDYPDLPESTPAADGGRKEVAQAANDVADAPVDAASRGALVSMISGDAQGKIQTSFTELATALRDEQAKRMDATVREMLQPMLSDWLEDNLPIIVERLVREEIERVARGPKRV
ncbi:DUF2497 domain-containing protein [Fulvimarina sp. MAC3]|uniref:PopZ family protein n=1 Tax=Fulvimarina sp. MAC3 TaxID=3148887 RepID=UPI0031FC98D2